MAYANEHIIQFLNNVKAPYNVNRLSQEVAVRALGDRTLFDERVTTILEVFSHACVLLDDSGLRPSCCGRLQQRYTIISPGSSRMQSGLCHYSTGCLTLRYCLVAQ